MEGLNLILGQAKVKFR